jgi:hypothetical protein
MARIAVRWSYIFRQNRNTTTISEKPKKAEESLATPSDSPNSEKDNAIVLK